MGVISAILGVFLIAYPCALRSCGITLVFFPNSVNVN
jgi:hypothetical protein